ncbi:GNAT family N-acetyltransferase [Dermatophilaceae bacterium Sec6.4]
MKIRPATAVDVATAPDWLEGVDLRPDRWRDQWTRAAVGFDAETKALLAVGRIFTSRVHDDRYWTEIMVAPPLRRRGHGTRIAEHLATLRPDPWPMCDRGFVGTERVLFSRSLGALPYQTCPPEHVRTADAAGLATSGAVQTQRGTDVGINELRRAWVDLYAWMHADWSPVAAGFEESLLEDFQDVDLVHTRVVVVDGQIRAGAFVFPDEPHPVVVAECRTRTETNGLMLLRACVRDSLLSLSVSNVTDVDFDGHDTDRHFRPLLQEIPASGTAFELLEWN